MKLVDLPQGGRYVAADSLPGLIQEAATRSIFVYVSVRAAGRDATTALKVSQEQALQLANSIFGFDEVFASATPSGSLFLGGPAK